MPIKVREGGAWVQVSDGTDGANGANGADGAVLQVQYKESNTVVDISAQNITPITGLSVNISPISATSKILLEANIMSNNVFVSSFGFALGAPFPITRLGGNTNTNSVNAISTIYSQALTTTDIFSMYSVTYRYLYTQSGLTPVGGFNFQACACSSWNGTLYNLRINDRSNFSDMRSTSSITATEIEV